MTKYIATAIGSAIIAAMGFSIWPVLWQTFGVMGGYMASVLVVSLMWYLNHWMGLFYNKDGVAWVDMAWGIAVGGIAWGLTRRDFDIEFSKAIPTLILAIVGGSIGGIAAEIVKKKHPSFQENINKEN